MCELSRYAWMSHSGCKFAEECERGGGDIGASWKTVPQCCCASPTHCFIHVVSTSGAVFIALGCLIAIFFPNSKFTLLKWDPHRCFIPSSFLRGFMFTDSTSLSSGKRTLSLSQQRVCLFSDVTQ